MKTQTQQTIRFKAQYLYLVSELIDNALFVKKTYENVCFIDNGIFSKRAINLINSYFNNVDIINIKDINNLEAKTYDLIIAPMALQFIAKIKYTFASINDALKPEGVIIASAFNVLQSADSVMEFKKYLDQQNLRPSLLNFFALGELMNKFNFKDKALDRENILIEGNKIELINVFCVKKSLENSEKTIKIVIN